MSRKKVKNDVVKYPTSRVMHIVIWMYDKEGKLVWTSERIRTILETRGTTIEKWGFILHDSDEYDIEGIEDIKERYSATYIDRYRMLANGAGLSEDETQESGYVFDESIELKAKNYANALYPLDAEVAKQKPSHWHIVLHFSNPRSVDSIARWFGIEPRWIKVPRGGYRAVESAFAYLVHLHDKHKYQYDPNDVIANFDYCTNLANLIKREKAHAVYHTSQDDVNDIINQVAMQGLSLNKVQETLTMAVYTKYIDRFKRAREKYVNDVMPMPESRQIYYVESVDPNGSSGSGKSIITRALAKQLASKRGADINYDYGDTALQEYIFDVGNKGVAFSGYDAQPVIVFDECSPAEMIDALGGVEGCKRVFSPFPARCRANRKYGDVAIMAQYIIINGIQSADDFIHSMAKIEAEHDIRALKDKGIPIPEEDENLYLLKILLQYQRRLWGKITIVDENTIEMYLNGGMWMGTREHTQYMLVKRAQINYKNVVARLKGSALAEADTKIFGAYIDSINEMERDKYGKNAYITDPTQIPDDIRASINGETEEVIDVQEEFF